MTMGRIKLPLSPVKAKTSGGPSQYQCPYCRTVSREIASRAA
jgi:hypothetical protein